jgi:GNAT superfamily N-acetyltransferase
VGVTIRALELEETYGLRRDVLRGGAPEAKVHYATDDHATTWHIGAVDEHGTVLATATFFPEPFPDAPAPGALRLRSMAVAPSAQGLGVGTAVIEAGLVRAASVGATLVWANARDSALGFYRACGFTVTDRRFVDPDSGLPHTVVVRSLR